MNKKTTIRALKDDRFICSNNKFKCELSEKFEMIENDENNSNILLNETPKKIIKKKPELKTSPCQAKITMTTYINLLKNQIFDNEQKPKEIKNTKFLGRKRIKNHKNKNFSSNIINKAKSDNICSNTTQNGKYNIDNIAINLNLKKFNFKNDTEIYTQKLQSKGKIEFKTCNKYNSNGVINYEQNNLFTNNAKKGYHKIISKQATDELTKCNFDDNNLVKNNSYVFEYKFNDDSLHGNDNLFYNIKDFCNEENDLFINNYKEVNFDNKKFLVTKENNNGENFSNNNLDIGKAYTNSYKCNFSNYNQTDSCINYDKDNLSRQGKFNLERKPLIEFGNFDDDYNYYAKTDLLNNKNNNNDNYNNIDNNKNDNNSNIYNLNEGENFYKNIIGQKKSLFKTLSKNSKSRPGETHLQIEQINPLLKISKKSNFVKFSELINIDNLIFPNEIDKENYNLRKRIPQIPYKVLDAPGLEDDFYQNLIEWSCKNLLAIGIKSQICLWNVNKNISCNGINLASEEFSKANIVQNLNFNNPTSENNSTLKIQFNQSDYSSESNAVSALNWISDGNDLVIGLKDGAVIIYDINNLKIKNAFFSHKKKIGMFSSFQANPNIFTSGAHDNKIIHFDVRMKVPIKILSNKHKEEICGLKWSNDSQILASGGNDNKLILWNSFDEKPLHIFNAHESAVRAIAWSYKKRGVFASGGGAYDKKIKIWDSKNLSLKYEAETNSQICNIAFSKNSNHFVTSHGFKDNVIYIWDQKQSDIEIITSLKGHIQRVIYLTQSPEGDCIATGSGDETVRLWKVFGFENKQKNDFNNFGVLDEHDFHQLNQEEKLTKKSDLDNSYNKNRIKSKNKGMNINNKDESINLLKLDNLR